MSPTPLVFVQDRSDSCRHSSTGGSSVLPSSRSELFEWIWILLCIKEALEYVRSPRWWISRIRFLTTEAFGTSPTRFPLKERLSLTGTGGNGHFVNDDDDDNFVLSCVGLFLFMSLSVVWRFLQFSKALLMISKRYTLPRCPKTFSGCVQLRRSPVGSAIIPSLASWLTSRPEITPTPRRFNRLWNIKSLTLSCADFVGKEDPNLFVGI